MRKIKILQDVVDFGLCTGCGACYSACQRGGVSLVNIESVGIRPRFDSSRCASCTECLSICPGYTVDSEQIKGVPSKQTEADHEFGPALAIWEGYAADPEIRHKASSGGILSALALYCLEQEDMAFVLHTGMNEAEPWMNQTVQSRTRQDLLSRTGSRYAPASPCEGLAAVEQSDRSCVFIGKPCDTTAAMALRRQRPELDQKLGLVLTFFCAGTPSTKGTLNLINELAFSTSDVGEVRYRGVGWPGRFRVHSKDRIREGSLSYEESWGQLTRYRPFRCNICPDGLGRVADISCGDAWEGYGDSTDSGRSIVIVRTLRGQEILHRAIAARYVELAALNAGAVFSAQKNLLGKRRELFGRLLAMKLLLLPVPRYHGFSLFRSWIRLPFLRKARTVLGTLRRLIQYGLWRKRALFTRPEADPESDL